MTAAEFWEQTPKETLMTIEAAVWRDERRQKLDIALAWRVAALSRQKRLPSLKKLLTPDETRPLRGKELKKRQQEFREMTKNLDVKALSQQLARKKDEE
jgi:hypothetical protein